MVAIALGVLVGWALIGMFRRMRRQRRRAEGYAGLDDIRDDTRSE
jgi:Tfp pilus assembly protein PilW